MAKPILILLSLIILSRFPLSSPLPTEAVLSAADILSNSGFISMALTLELLSTSTLTSQPPSATIFSPADAAFVESGQPPLSVLQVHFSPLAFSLESLRSLPYGTRIPTLSSGKSLIVTTTDPNLRISLNNVTVSGSPIYDDGSLIVFGVERFFDPNFEITMPPIQGPGSDLQCVVSNTTLNSSSGPYSFVEASGMLRSRGYSVMASFLDLQMLGSLDRAKLTVLAPVDDVMLKLVSNFSEFSSLFLRHAVPCKLTWSDLTNLDDGTALTTFSDGFTIKITKVNDMLMLNNVPLTFPDMYYSDWLVVHGLRQVLELPGTTEPSYGFGRDEGIAPSGNEF